MKNYIYFGMAFPFGIKMLNMLMRNGQKRLKAQVVQRNESMLEDATKVYDDEAK